MALVDQDTFLSHCEQKKYKSRSTIVYADDNSQILYYLIKGSVTIAIEDNDGKEIIVDYLHEGDFLNEINFVDNTSPNKTWVHAKTECQVAEISYEKFQQLCLKHPQWQTHLQQQIAKRLNKTIKKIGTLAFYDVTSRIAYTLLELCNEPDAMTHPNGMQIKVSRQEISRLVGCSREMVGRVLKTLEDQGMLEVHGQTMIVFGTR